jgi:hypothetical protein
MPFPSFPFDTFGFSFAAEAAMGIARDLSALAGL